MFHTLGKDSSGNIGWWDRGSILLDGRFVRNTADLNAELAKKISFQTIFNTWERFRVGGTAGEENSWSYVSATDRVVCTINSAGYIGFISPDKYDNYSHDATLTSTNSDNDMIGVVIAAYRESSSKLHTLTAVRCASVEGHILSAGVGTQWAITYNFNDSDAKLMVNGHSKLVSPTNAGWSTYANGTKIRVRREGDVITCTTTQMNSTAWDANTTLTLNLTSDPLLAKFRGKSPYGYSCLSQDQSTFSSIVFSDVSSMIFDLEGKKVYTFKNGAWSVDATQNIATILGEGRFLFNPSTKKLFFIRDINNIINIIG